MPTHEQDDMSITRATEADIDNVVRLFDDYRQFYGQPTDVTGAKKFLNARISLDESVILLARRGDRAVGFVQLYPSFSSVAMRRIWVLNDLYVSPDGRRAGVATALLDAACDHGTATGAVRLELATAKNNDVARKLYARNGWQQDEVFVHYQRRV